MAGINTLQEVYKKRGEEWTREFLSSELRITEKAEAYRFSFELSKNGKLRFYGKNAEDPLNRIDRTVSDLYESAIGKIEKLPDAIIGNLPRSHRFGFNWAPDNGLTLTDITVRQHGKVTKQIHEKTVLERWASLLHVKYGEEVYKGKLEETKVETLMESLRRGESPLFETISNQKTYIIRGEEGIAKITPSQPRQIREQKSHGFDLLLLQIYEHLEGIDFEKFVFRSERPDERYLEIVCEAFNHFVAERGVEFLEMGIKKPTFLEKSGKFNPKWIRNNRTLSYISESKDYEYLLSIFITNLRKPKKATGLLTESFVDNYNKTIHSIDEAVRNADDYEFPEFNSILEKENDLRTDNGFSEDDSMKAVAMMQAVFALPYRGTHEEEEPEVKHECNVLAMNMGQFTNKVLNECERILKLTGKGFTLIHDINAGENCKWGMAKEDGARAANQLVKDYPHIFECSESLSNPTIAAIQKAAGPRDVKRIYTGRSCDSLVKECDLQNTISGKKLDLEITKVAGNSDREIEECMDREDYKTFKEIFPDSIQKFWEPMRTQWNSKAYL
jgi:hypothetical protein